MIGIGIAIAVDIAIVVDIAFAVAIDTEVNVANRIDETGALLSSCGVRRAGRRSATLNLADGERRAGCRSAVYP
ncbi:MAG: hypothetical protein KA419_14255 [Acidobacteria bacterium]|nr:hypothetical protein [Acidobacteriota bacterium]